MNYMSDKTYRVNATQIRCKIIYEVRSVKSHRVNMA